MSKYYLNKEQIGIIREVDTLGRMVIPKDLRSMFKLDKEVEIIPTPEGILLRNPEYRLVKVKKFTER